MIVKLCLHYLHYYLTIMITIIHICASYILEHNPYPWCKAFVGPLEMSVHLMCQKTLCPQPTLVLHLCLPTRLLPCLFFVLTPLNHRFSPTHGLMSSLLLIGVEFPKREGLMGNGCVIHQHHHQPHLILITCGS